MSFSVIFIFCHSHNSDAIGFGHKNVILHKNSKKNKLIKFRTKPLI